MRLRAARMAALVAALAAVATLVAATAGAAAGGAAAPTLTRVQRVPFPNREYVIDLQQSAALTAKAVQVTENGKPVQDVVFTPLAGSGVGFGAVLAIDASDSMRGGPFAGAVAAAKSFIAKRGVGEAIGLIAFNNGIHVLQGPSQNPGRLQRLLVRHPPALANGTRIYDAVGKALNLIKTDKKLSTASIVLLTDGKDVGSKTSLNRAIALAQKQNVRIFTVGLRSPSFDPSVLQAIATKTGGAYAEATSASGLKPIYATLSNKLAQEYLLEYHSPSRPRTQVSVQVSVKGFAPQTDSYTAPTPAGLAPYHESFMTRFLLSGFSLFLLALVVAILIVYVVQGLLKRTQSDLVERVAAFAGERAVGAPRSAAGQRRDLRARRRAAASSARGALANLERTLEIADIQLSAPAVVALTIVGTLIVIIFLAVISPVFAVVGLMTPLVSRGLVRRKLKKVRGDFAEQLPANLQILASALRSGYSFVAALTTVVEQAQEPTQRELRRVLADVQLAVPMDEALRRAAKRMNSRDLEQVALVAELQLTTGGNVAEVLDVVVGTIRDRQDVRRLLKTLTAQGRMARWILTLLPIVTGLVFYAYQPDVVGPYFSKAIGQITLVIAAILVTSGSFVIQKIVDIEV